MCVTQKLQLSNNQPSQHSCGFVRCSRLDVTTGNERYGPTETTCASNVHVYKKGDHSSNIGTPIHSSVSALVLDDKMRPLPVGVSWMMSVQLGSK